MSRQEGDLTILGGVDPSAVFDGRLLQHLSPQMLNRALPTDEARQRLSAVRSIFGETVDPVAEAEAQQAMRRAEHDLRLAERRDEILATRPEGCWCWGRGGRGPVGISAPAGEPPFETFREFCSCPEGGQAERAKVTAVRRYKAWVLDQRRERVWGLSGIPEVFRGVTFESWLEQYVLHGGKPARGRGIIKTIQDWVTGDQFTNLALIGCKGSDGSVGAGKTGLSIAVMSEYGRLGKIVQFVNVVDLMLRLRGSMDRDTQVSELSIVESLSRVDLLVVDDLGKHQGTEYARSILYQIIDQRYLHRLKMIVTANVESLEQLELQMDRATFSRLIYRCKTIQLDDINLRAKG